MKNSPPLSVLYFKLTHNYETVRKLCDIVMRKIIVRISQAFNEFAHFLFFDVDLIDWRKKWNADLTKHANLENIY